MGDKILGAPNGIKAPRVYHGLSYSKKRLQVLLFTESMPLCEPILKATGARFSLSAFNGM